MYSTMVRPMFKLDLPDSEWSTIVVSDGSHFYHNRTTKQSVWRADDDELRHAISRVDRRSLLLLTAKARGLAIDDDASNVLLSTAVTHSVEEPSSQAIQDEVHPDPQEDEKISPVEGPLVPKITGLVSGYSSSEDEDEDDEEEDEDVEERGSSEVPPSKADDPADETPVPSADLESDSDHSNTSSDTGNGFDLGDLDGISSDEEVETTSTNANTNDVHDIEQAEILFLKMLQESSLNPYSTWEIESLKVIDDPRFLEVESNKERKRLFDTWCSLAISARTTSEEANLTKRRSDPPFVEFMRLLESKQCDRFYLDFNKKWKIELDKCSLSDREKEKAYKEYVIFTKKNQTEREKIFKTHLSAKIFKKNVLSANGAKDVLSAVDLNKVDVMTDDEAYDTLCGIEDALDISEGLKFATKYFVVDVKTRIRLIMELTSQILG